MIPRDNEALTLTAWGAFFDLTAITVVGDF